MSTILPDIPLLGFPPERIRLYPAPGTATEEDVLEVLARSGRICELIDGTLVEKTMTTYESMLAFELAYFIRGYLATHKLGVLAGGDGLLKILPGQIRAPDVSFIRWEQLPARGAPKPPIYPAVPDLAVEVLSKGNTAEEMERKLREYFQAGVRLVWTIEPKTRTARAYTAPGEGTEIGPDGSLLGGEVLPGFVLPLAQLFVQVEGPKEE
jgi:Uma2 family endonuclease